jgi:N-acetylmuramoyl-L-alanine amidase
MEKEQEERNQSKQPEEIGSGESTSSEEQEPVRTKGQKIRSALLEVLIYAAIVVVCVLVVPRYVMQRTIVDGTSMESTLQDEDNLLVDKLSYHLSDPKRFDVIVFYPYGRENEDYYIKRVIGLPGETIQIVGDTIYIDGEVLEEDYGKDPMTQSGIAEEPLTLGDDEYFVLGDNRAISEDSRFEVGPVSRDKIEGKAVLRIYPFSKFGLVSSIGKKAKAAVRSAATKVVAIDAGHQSRGNSSTEAIGPGASTKKAKVSGGATGVSSRVPEYKLTLQVAKKLRKELLSRGYKVIMSRTKNNVNISNKQRALAANKGGADICIRLHADSSTSSGVRGASALYPSASNPYVGKLSSKSKRLSECILKNYCNQTGIKNRGLSIRNDLTGTNWSTIPVTLIEMGFLSNSTEDRLMQKSSTQKKMVQGIADGVDAYFK